MPDLFCLPRTSWIFKNHEFEINHYGRNYRMKQVRYPLIKTSSKMHMFLYSGEINVSPRIDLAQTIDLLSHSTDITATTSPLAPLIWRVSRRQCALHEFTYLLTHLLTKHSPGRLVWNFTHVTLAASSQFRSATSTDVFMSTEAKAFWLMSSQAASQWPGTSMSNTIIASSALTTDSRLLPMLHRRALLTRQCFAVRRLLCRWKWCRFNVGADCRRLKNDFAVWCFTTIAVSCASVDPTTHFAASCMQHGLEMHLWCNTRVQQQTRVIFQDSDSKLSWLGPTGLKPCAIWLESNCTTLTALL